MFKNVGKTIMHLAIFLAALEITLGVIIGIIFLTRGILALVGIVIIIASIITGWISNMFLYAFGQLVDDVHVSRDRVDKHLTPQQSWNQIPPQYYQQSVPPQYYQPPTTQHNCADNQTQLNNL